VKPYLRGTWNSKGRRLPGQLPRPLNIGVPTYPLNHPSG
jgi:hypothetical protein